MASIQSKSISVEASTKGAELRSIKGPNGLEYLWQGDPAFWPRRSPLLFPIVGALPGGSYSHLGKSYRLGNHGFVRDLEFELAAQGQDFLRYTLRSDESSLLVYPFRFELSVTYKVEADRLSVGYEVVNADSRPMPFSIGAHPAFRAPLVEGERREDFDLVFERRETVDRWFLNADNLRTGERAHFLSGSDSIPLSASLFEKGAVVLTEHLSRTVTLRSRSSGRFVELSFPDFPQLGIWAPKDGAAGPTPFVCIEPWFGVMALADSGQEIERKEAVRSLAPGSRFAAAYTIRVG
jgi:Galactose mutarotase and related enzymes